jgi:cytochrome c556
MRGKGLAASILGPGTFAVLLLAAPGARAADPADPQAAFAHRADTMKRMGRALYTTIGRVVRGKAEFGPETVEAADTIVSLAATIETLFPPGSAIGESRAKPEIFAAAPQVAELAAGVRAAAAPLLEAAKGGDKTALASAAQTLDKACEACHGQFRKPE